MLIAQSSIYYFSTLS